MTKYGGRETKVHYTLVSHEEKLRKNLLSNQIVDLVDTMLYRAIELDASDIHLQPESLGLRVRYRLDGLLSDYELINPDLMGQVQSRIKVLSALDIAERRVPQDGTFTVIVSTDNKQVPIDIRVATFPSTYGEKMVLRILNRSKTMLSIASLGINTDMLKTLERLISLPYGLFLVTGPTGAGKTTSLYAMLSQMDHLAKNIITMEDPVEFDLPGITQTQVNNKLGLTFGNGLRSMLRQDPDVIMVGEIRDVPTVQMAIEAALTGHLVLSTLHTNNAAGAITRLLDMGVEPFLINASLVAVLAQRLVRKLCVNCKQQQLVGNEVVEYLKQAGCEPIDKVWQATGCKHCAYRGYSGRIGIFELLLVDDAIRRLVVTRAHDRELELSARAQGFVSLLEQGVKLVQAGIISFEELIVVLG